MNSPVNSPDRALVLGPGGPVGAAWTAGLVTGLRRAGVDLGEADLTVGTSAGAIVAAALLAGGHTLERLAAPVRPTGVQPPRPDAERTARVFAVLGDRSLDPGDARRRVGRIAVEHAAPEDEAALLARRATLLDAAAWPEQRLLITAVDTVTGEPAVWDRTSDVPLVRAVAASSAFPGAEPPVTVRGSRYMDGALRAGSNADLASGARIAVLVEPMARLREPLDRQTGAHGTQILVSISPDAASVPALGSDPADVSAWDPAYQAGLRQGEGLAASLRPLWTAGADTA